MYWPLVNTVMYTMVRPSYMSMYTDVASLVFASIMSYIMYNGSCAAATTPAQSSNLLDSSTAGVSTMVTTLAEINRAHLLSILLDGARVEA